jgi:hypothetical protein
MAIDPELSLMAVAACERQDRSSCDRNSQRIVGSTTSSARSRASETLSRI